MRGRGRSAKQTLDAANYGDFLDPQGIYQGDGVPHGALLAIRGHHRHLAQLAQFFMQGPEARGVNTVVVGQQNHNYLISLSE